MTTDRIRENPRAIRSASIISTQKVYDSQIISFAPILSYYTMNIVTTYIDKTGTINANMLYNGKDDYVEIMDKGTGFFWESYLCEEYERRTLQNGYRG